MLLSAPSNYWDSLSTVGKISDWVLLVINSLFYYSSSLKRLSKGFGNIVLIWSLSMDLKIWSVEEFNLAFEYWRWETNYPISYYLTHPGAIDPLNTVKVDKELINEVDSWTKTWPALNFSQSFNPVSI